MLRSGLCSTCQGRVAIKILMSGMWQTFKITETWGAVELGLVDTPPHLGIVCYVNAKDSSLKLARALLSLPLASFCKPW